MRKNYFYALMAVALALTACSKDVPEKDKLPSGNTITILANVAPQSRAPQLATDGSGNFSKGDVLSLFVGGNGISTVATDFAYDSYLGQARPGRKCETGDICFLLSQANGRRRRDI